jgi:riboflavin kinase/FMN adenylyltransferase
MSGRYFRLEGRVITGNSRGIELGFPTANLDIDPQQALPADGVYAALAYIDNKSHQSVVNIGKRPTFGDGRRIVEVYILDYHGDLYRYDLKIDIMERLRGEKRFTTPEELKKQITKDVKRVRIILKGIK